MIMNDLSISIADDAIAVVLTPRMESPAILGVHLAGGYQIATTEDPRDLMDWKEWTKQRLLDHMGCLNKRQAQIALDRDRCCRGLDALESLDTEIILREPAAADEGNEGDG